MAKDKDVKFEENLKEEKSSFYASKIAKKDFIIHHNEVHIEIKKGEALPKNIEERFIVNLKTEGVI